MRCTWLICAFKSVTAKLKSGMQEATYGLFILANETICHIKLLINKHESSDKLLMLQEAI